jgi:hypothetical protein
VPSLSILAFDIVELGGRLRLLFLKSGLRCLFLCKQIPQCLLPSPLPTSRPTLSVFLFGDGRVHKQVCGVRGLTSLQKAWAMYSIPLLTAALMFATIGLLHVTDKLRCRRRPRMPSIRSHLRASEQCTTVVEGSSDSSCDAYSISGSDFDSDSDSDRGALSRDNTDSDDGGSAVSQPATQAVVNMVAAKVPHASQVAATGPERGARSSVTFAQQDSMSCVQFLDDMETPPETPKRTRRLSLLVSRRASAGSVPGRRASVGSASGAARASTYTPAQPPPAARKLAHQAQHQQHQHQQQEHCTPFQQAHPGSSTRLRGASGKRRHRVAPDATSPRAVCDLDDGPIFAARTMCTTSSMSLPAACGATRPDPDGGVGVGVSLPLPESQPIHATPFHKLHAMLAHGSSRVKRLLLAPGAGSTGGLAGVGQTSQGPGRSRSKVFIPALTLTNTTEGSSTTSLLKETAVATAAAAAVAVAVAAKGPVGRNRSRGRRGSLLPRTMLATARAAGTRARLLAAGTRVCLFAYSSLVSTTLRLLR